jgi:hypothetical protein
MRVNPKAIVTLAAAMLAISACNHGTTSQSDSGSTGMPDAFVPVPDGGPVSLGDAAWWFIPDAGYTPVDGGVTATAVLPARGPNSGQTTVIIYGNNFYEDFASGATAAYDQTRVFFGTNEVSSFQVIDNGRIEAQTPPNTVGPVDVFVTNPNGTAKCASCFTYYTQLILENVSPNSGPVVGGNVVNLTGQGFTPDCVVQFGGVASPQVKFVSATSMTAVAPPGAGPGLVDVRVFNENGVSDVLRVYDYTLGVAVTSVTPPGGPLTGTNSVVVNGANFGTVTGVSFGGVAAAVTAATATTVTVTVPAGAATGAVDVTVQTSAGNATLKGGYVYFDPTQVFSVAGVYPTHGPAAGGNTVTIVGTGLGSATFTFEGAAAAVTSASANLVSVTVPTGSANTNADVSAIAGSTVTLAGGYHYNLALTSVAPASGPPAGGTAVTLTGAGFAGTLNVMFGSLAATGVSIVSPTSITATTPPGGGGSVAVTVIDVNDSLNTSTLASGFTYNAPLSVLLVQPPQGAIAGGTFVTALGTGFTPTTTISIGGSPLRNVNLIDPNTITGNTPPGTAGIVDVTGTDGTATSVLTGGFTYFDPKSSEGGSSGGPLQGTINVTVLDMTPGDQGAPIPQALVQLGTDPTTLFQGLTDANGQITFSDPSLVKPVQVTVSKSQYLSVTVLKQQSENLTVFLFFNGGSPQPPSSVPPTPPSIISGKVFGFKLSQPLTATQEAWAEVWVANQTLYECPPFGTPPTAAERDAAGEKWRLTQDGDTYSIYANAGLNAVYAVYGIFDTSTQVWTPLYMGVARSVTTSPDSPATNVNIVLNMHLDESVPLLIDNPAELPGSTTLPLNDVNAYFELGGNGVICMGDVTSAQSTFSIGSLPEVLGDSLVFFNEATSSAAPNEESGYFAQAYGDVASTGVVVGPMLGLLQISTPAANAPFTGNISFSLGAGPSPSMYEVIYGLLGAGGTVPLWHVVMPGTENSVTIPSNVLSAIQGTLQSTDQTVVLVIGSVSPRFEFSAWNYGQVGLGGISEDWTSFTYGGEVVGQ